MIRPLGDDYSEVTLINHMGDDLMVCDAARVSFAKEASQFTKENNDKLIHYLARHGHWSPFAHPQIQFRFKMPFFLARQYFKHTIGAAKNEVSRRYVDDTPEFYIPNEWRLRAENVKQGSSNEVHLNSETISRYVHQVCYQALDVYEKLLDAGIAPEQARMVLPMNTYTEFIETGSLAFYARVYNQRSKVGAQQEIKAYAEAIASIISSLFPVAWKELTNEAS